MKSIKKVKIIAEIGVNHNGNVKKAKKLIDVAKSAGADFVKFQVFDSENLVIADADLAEYQKKGIKKNQSKKLIKKISI